MVPEVGVEPTHLAVRRPKRRVSAIPPSGRRYNKKGLIAGFLFQSLHSSSGHNPPSQGRSPLRLFVLHPPW